MAAESPAPLSHRRAVIIHSLPVRGDNVNHSGLQEKGANEDVMRAAESAAFLNSLASCHSEGRPQSPAFPPFTKT